MTRKVRDECRLFRRKDEEIQMVFRLVVNLRPAILFSSFTHLLRMQDNAACATCGAIKGGCGCPHHKMVPLFITLIGLVFLLKTLGTISMGFADVAWPVLLILVGLQKMFGRMCKCCSGKM